MAAQLGLGLRRAPSYAVSAFVVSGSNALAARTLDAWPDWRGGALVLVGPAGSGKTHLASIWAARVGAEALQEDRPDALLDAPALLEDADGRLPDEGLFHLLNSAGRSPHGLLLTSRLPPGQWPAHLPDLRSRLNALPVAEIAEPDDAVLTAMLDSAFRERNVRPAPDLLSYLAQRIERSAQSARDVVARLDEAAYASHRAVSQRLARQVLDEAPPIQGSEIEAAEVQAAE